MKGKRLGLWMVMCVMVSLTGAASVLLADTAPVRFVGQPTFDDGEALGYFIWRDGDTWKLRWTTFGGEHRFTGRITLEGGEITSFDRVDVDTERKVLAPGRPGRVVRGPRGRVVGVTGGRAPVVATREEDTIEQETEQLIRFATVTRDDLDGLNFKVNNATRILRFVLEIDGIPRPAEVEVGRENFTPNENPIVVRLR
jgi:hypothetical protein